MRAAAPAWGPWTPFYDSVGQVPSMTRGDSEDGLVVSFNMDRMQLTLQGDEAAPFTGAIGLSGALSVSMPDQFPLLGFLLTVNGELQRSVGCAAVVTCSVGAAAQSIEWPIADPAGIQAPEPSRTVDERASGGSVLDTGFSLECFTRDTPPGGVGAPPFPQLPPLPITVSLQARRRFVDEFLFLTVVDLTVQILRV